jgi:tetratricopeptide (TPR) repeat protein
VPNPVFPESLSPKSDWLLEKVFGKIRHKLRQISPIKSMKIPGYRILREIGRGNMSTVYLAVQELLEREVALKVMALSLIADETFCTRFLKEGKIIAQLSHPNIITVHDIGASGSNYYMALEYAKAGNLSRRLKNLSRNNILEIIKQIASALGYAHSRGFIHRDVKPANVLFRDDQSVLLSDFGIAKGIDSKSQLTMIGWSIGTPEYMSPEQAMGKPVSPQADLYSLGIMLYRMLAGRCPYVSDDPFATALMHINVPIPNLPKYYSEFQPIVSRLLQKNPADRYADAWELIRAIEKVQTRGASVISLAGRRLEPGRKSRKFGRTVPAGSQHTAVRTTSAAAGALQIDEDLEEESTTLITQIVAVIGTAYKATVKISSILWLKVLRNISTLWWSLGTLALLIVIGMGFYLVELLGPFGGVDLAARSIRPKNPADYILAKDKYLQEVALAYRSILQIDPKNITARKKSNEIAAKYEELAQSSWAIADKDLSLSLIEQGLSVVPQHTGLLSLKSKLEGTRSTTELSVADKKKIELWIRTAEDHIASSHFIMPVGNNAVETYRKILQLDPKNETALHGLNAMASIFERAARASLVEGDANQAILRIEQGLMISPRQARLLSLRAALVR